MGAAAKNGNYGTKMEARDSLSHKQNFDAQSATPLAQLANMLKPGATGRDLVELLDRRARRTQALAWRSGRRGTPKWAIDLLIAKIHARASATLSALERFKSVPDRPGYVGAKNLAAWKARQNK
jgi:hypothetical protein